MRDCRLGLGILIALLAWTSEVRSQSIWTPRLIPEPKPQVAPAPKDEPPLIRIEPLMRTDAAVMSPQYSLPRPARPHVLFDDDPGDPPGLTANILGLPALHATARTPVRLDTLYDTGFVGSGVRLAPSTIALNGTTAAARRGRFQMSPNTTMLDFGVISPEGQFRTDVQLDFLDDVRLRLLKGQVADLAFGGRLYGGRTYTTFMDEYALPVTITPDTSAAGAVYRLQPVLGYAIPIRERLTIGGAIELGPTEDFVVPTPATDARLQRFPDAVVAARYSSSPDERGGDTLQVAALVRGMGYQNAASDEHFAAGWGVSVMAKLQMWHHDKLLFGVVGGQGIGSYIFGFSDSNDNNRPAATPEGADLRTLLNLGTHIGYTRTWAPGKLLSNAGYGFAYADPTAIGVQYVHNTWVNSQWRVTKTIAFGLEYHYALRQIRDGTQGDTHRVMLVTQFLP